ncbi:hypothetical protein [Hydrogenophaga atypica]|uniref:Integrase n=1 Tax=Hydrogenophaga atypica TaxID=249409 RepID=A0ABW2QRJ6_9BURK
MSLRQHVEMDTHHWVSKQNKVERRRKRVRMLAFAKFAEAKGARHPGQVGSNTVVSFWKHLRTEGLAWETQRDYWYSIKALWEIWGKPDEPPQPRKPVQPADDSSQQRQQVVD